MKIRHAFAFTALILSAAAAATAANAPFVDYLKSSGARMVSYSPTNFDPRRVSAGGAFFKTPSAASITQDLQALRPAFNGIILYGTQTDVLDNGQPFAAWIVAEARRLGFSAVMLGVWNVKDNAELDAAAGLVALHGTSSSFALAVCAGNEGILRNEYGIADLNAAKARLLSKFGGAAVPIVTSEDLARYTLQPALRAWGDFLFPIIVPHWNQPSLLPADAAAWVRQQGALLADQSGLTVVVKEAAFPSGGQTNYTPETQRQFFAAYLAGPAIVDSTKVAGTFVAYNTALEAFDQLWKASPDFTTWGLMSAGRTPKPAFALFVQPVPAELLTPTPGSTLTSATQTFTWNSGQGVTQYSLSIGSSPGSTNYFSHSGAGTSATATGLPLNGSTVHVRLGSLISGAWQAKDYQYLTANTAGGSGKAEMLTPVAGATLSGASQTFTWTAGTGVTQYWLYAGSTAGAYDFYSGSQGANTSGTIGSLPVDGSPIHIRLWSLLGGNWVFNDYQYKAAGAGGGGGGGGGVTTAPAQILTPAAGSTLASTTQAFTWSAGQGVTQYSITIGNTVGGSSYFSYTGPNTSATATGLPNNGVRLHVRLSSLIGGTWQSTDYQYQASSLTTDGTGSGAASILTPAPGATLSGATQSFTWSPGQGISEYWLYVGNAEGAYNFYSNSQGGNTSGTIGNLPVDGSTLYVRLWSKVGSAGAWIFRDYQFKAAVAASSGGGGTGGGATTTAPAQMLAPAAGATLTSSSQSFTWSAGQGVTQYALYAGSSAGNGNYHTYTGGATTVTATGLPTSGGTIYVRLASLINGSWQSTDYQYQAANTSTGGTGGGTKAQMLTPAAGSKLSGASQTFTWSPGSGASQYWLFAGNAPGAFNFYSSSQGLGTGAVVNNLPVDGSTVYVRLWSLISGTWVYNDYQYATK